MQAQAISERGSALQERDLRAVRRGRPDESGSEQSSSPRYSMSTTQTVNWHSISPGSSGNLLAVLPVPAMLIDEAHQVVVANQCCQFASIQTRTGSLPFESLLALPRDRERAGTLKQRARQVIEEAFTAQGPRVAEAILTLGGKRVWARLQMRKIRIEGERFLLVLVENLTEEGLRERVDKAAIASLAAMNKKLGVRAP